MASIKRDIKSAADCDYDIIIIGGGIHGVMMALESSRRNLKSLLLEKSDFGGATSYNSLRIIHGGFRYLQSLDIPRVLESAHERRWYQKNFPQLVKPMPCLFPLYGKGLRHPLFFGPAMTVYNLITHHRNHGMVENQLIPDAGVIDKNLTLELFPGLSPDGLKGGGVWYDAFMADSQRILIGCLRWATSLGLSALNYVRVTDLIESNGKVVGLSAIDEETGVKHEFRSGLVVNMAGPWCREVAGLFHKDIPSLFKSMLAWNVLFDRPAVSRYAAAITNGDSSARTFFSVPWKGKFFVGTGQAPWKHPTNEPKVTEEQLQCFCNDLNKILPFLKLKTDDIVKVYAGLQCATHAGGTEFTKRKVFIDHSKMGGPKGLFSISGIKFTTARSVAEKTLSHIFKSIKKGKPDEEKPPSDAARARGTYSYDWSPDIKDPSWKKELETIIKDESVLHVDDLIFRRTSIGDNPKRAMILADDIVRIFDWKLERQIVERKRLEACCSSLLNSLIL